VRQQIHERRAEMEADNLEGNEQPGPFQYVAAEVHDVMAEFEYAVHYDEDVNVDEILSQKHLCCNKRRGQESASY